MSVNRREVLKSGAAGFLLGFLFRGRNGKLSEEPEIADQPPSAITIRTMPQQAFRPQRLVIAGTVIGKRMVPETKFVTCEACDGHEDYGYEYDYGEPYCEVCNDIGGTMVETGALVERDVTIVPWLIENISIGTRSQLAQAGAIPGDLFRADSVENFMSLDAAGAGQEIEIIVRYTGDKPDGEVFRGALVGTSIGEDGMPRQSILPINSSQKIVALNG